MSDTQGRAKVNLRCPDYMSHVQNVIDRLYPNVNPSSIGAGWVVIDIESEIEYMNCEGHE